MKFFFNDTATTEIYALSLHDALPILNSRDNFGVSAQQQMLWPRVFLTVGGRDRKSTRLNSSHSQISYAVFCLKKKKRFYVQLRKQLHHNAACDTQDIHQRAR